MNSVLRKRLPSIEGRSSFAPMGSPASGGACSGTGASRTALALSGPSGSGGVSGSIAMLDRPPAARK